MARAGKTILAFTLLELLVAMALFTLVAVLLASVFSSTQKGVVLLGSAKSQRQDARAVLGQVAGELRAALEPPTRSFEGAQAAMRQPQLLVNPSGLTNGSSLFWSAGADSRSGGSALVGYLLRWETTPEGPRPRFCRVFLDADGSEIVEQTLRTSASPEWVSQALVNSNAPGDAANGYQGWISDNILAFYARALDPQMNAITNFSRGLSGPAVNTSSANAVFAASATGNATLGSFDSRNGYQYTRRPDNVTVNRFGPALPSAIELVVIAAPPSSIRQLQTAPAPVLSGNATAMWTDVASFLGSLPEPVRNAAKTYSTIVPIAVQQ